MLCFAEYFVIPTSNCNVIAVLVGNFWLKYFESFAAKWKFTVNFHQFWMWMLSFEEIFQHQIFINYKLPSCSLQVEKYHFNFTLWFVFSRVFTLGRMFFKSGLEGLGFKTILFIGTVRLMMSTHPDQLETSTHLSCLTHWKMEEWREWREAEELNDF